MPWDEDNLSLEGFAWPHKVAPHGACSIVPATASAASTRSAAACCAALMMVGTMPAAQQCPTTAVMVLPGPYLVAGNSRRHS